MGVVNATQMRKRWTIMPDRRTVTYRVRTATTPTYTNYTLTDAWYRPEITAEGAPSNGVYIKRFRRWFVVKEKLDAVGIDSPQAGDAITSTASTIDPQSGQWTVLDIDEVGALGAYSLRCVQLDMRSSLAVTVLIKRPTGAKDNSGRRNAFTTSTAYTTTGYFQADTTETDPDLLGKLQVPTKGVVYVQAYLSDIRATDTVLVGGVSYNIMAVDNQNRLDELQAIRVELAR